jgi:[protein-PII] uridylyltransferase
VTDITGSKNITTQKLSLLNKYLHELHENKISVEDLLSSPLEWVSYNNIPEGMVEEIIDFDNTVSPDYTILEIKLPDSIGLLYRLIKVIISFDIQLHFVRVSTSADFAFDTFYLQDKTGLKITDSSKLETIRESLTNAKQEKTSTKIESIEF